MRNYLMVMSFRLYFKLLILLSYLIILRVLTMHFIGFGLIIVFKEIAITMDIPHDLARFLNMHRKFIQKLICKISKRRRVLISRRRHSGQVSSRGRMVRG